MKIKFELKPHLTETEVTITSAVKNDEVKRIIDALKNLNRDVVGQKGQEKIILKLVDILYFESVDDKVFAYTAQAAIEIKSRLYELEALSAPFRFARISISKILNLNAIVAFKSSLNGRMEARLINDEWIEISRSFVPALKQQLGGQ